MKKNRIFTVSVFIIGLFIFALMLLGCDLNSLRDRIVCEYYYYVGDENSNIRECEILKQDVSKQTGNKLDLGGVTIAPPGGYYFDGFYDSDTGEKMFDSDLQQVRGTRIDGLVYLYPIWVPVEFTFLFVESEVNGMIKVDEQKTFTLTTEEFFEKDFYEAIPTEYNTEFIGWYANSDKPNEILDSNKCGTTFKWNDNYYKHERSYIDQNGVKHEGDFIIVRPKFDTIKRIVTLKAITQNNKIYETIITVVNNDPLPDLSSYNGMYEDRYIYDFSISKTEYIPFEGNVVEDITLYAVWEEYKNVTLHFSDEHKSSLIVKEITPTTFPFAEKEHYTFVGWYDNDAFEGASINVPEFTDETNDYYAKWNPVSYPLIFETNGGTEIDNSNYVYGMCDTLPQPEKSYNKFLGWCLDKELLTTPIYEVPINMVGELKLYAKWESSIAISTKEELLAVKNNPNGGYYLTNDINLEGETWTPIETFSGMIDGNNYAIKNFSLQTSTAKENYAFFGKNYGTITNLTLKDMSLGYYNVQYSAVLCAQNYGIIDNCHVISKNSDLTACSLQYAYYESTSGEKVKTITSMAGAIVAYNASKAKVTNCSSSTPIKVTYNTSNSGNRINGHFYIDLYIAEICGQNDGVVLYCDATREIDISGNSYCENGLHNSMFPDVFTINNYIYIGGIVGKNTEGAILSNGISTVNISSEITFSGGAKGFIYSNIGGAVGYNSGKVMTTYSDGVSVSGNFVHHHTNIVGLGGVVGRNMGTGEIMNCYSKDFFSTATNITTGGLIGNNFGIVQTSYVLDALIKVNTSSIGWYIGGFVGYNHTTASIKNSICRVIIDLPFAHALVQQFAGDTVGVMMSCYYSDAGKEIIAGVTQDELTQDAKATQLLNERMFSKSFLIDELYWNESVWKIDGVNAPKLLE